MKAMRCVHELTTGDAARQYIRMVEELRRSTAPRTSMLPSKRALTVLGLFSRLAPKADQPSLTARPLSVILGNSLNGLE